MIYYVSQTGPHLKTNVKINIIKMLLFIFKKLFVFYKYLFVLVVDKTIGILGINLLL